VRVADPWPCLFLSRYGFLVGLTGGPSLGIGEDSSLSSPKPTPSMLLPSVPPVPSMLFGGMTSKPGDGAGVCRNVCADNPSTSQWVIVQGNEESQAIHRKLFHKSMTGSAFLAQWIQGAPECVPPWS
jgi:hypothetical protein